MARSSTSAGFAALAALFGTLGAPARADEARGGTDGVIGIRDAEVRALEWPGRASVVTEPELAALAIRMLPELSYATPFLEIGQQEGNVELFLQGVGSLGNSELEDPAVALLLDGVYIPRQRGARLPLFDLERVELHRGPLGVLVGRNALGGALAIVSAQPVLDERFASASLQLGNYSQQTLRATLNVPIGPALALRAAGQADRHDAFFENAGVAALDAAEQNSSLAYRLGLKWQPLDMLRLSLGHDYSHEDGTGWSGADFMPVLQAAVQPSDIERPRAVVYRGPQGRHDARHWGLRGQVDADWGPLHVEYRASWRSLEFRQTSAGSAGVAVPDRPSPELDDFSTSYWHSTSRSIEQQLEISGAAPSGLRWTLGGSYLDDRQQVFLGLVADRAAFAAEYNVPDMSTRAASAFADGTLELGEHLRAGAGIRGTRESKVRRGIANLYAFDNVPAGARSGTPGFRFAEWDRDFSMLGPLPPFSDFTNGVARWGDRDTLDDLIQLPGVAQQGMLLSAAGDYEATFVDVRAALELELARQHLLYSSLTSGHRSGGFNDPTRTIVDSGAVDVVIDYGPESGYALTLGSKNAWLYDQLVASVTAFAEWYDDLQMSRVPVVPALPPSGVLRVRTNAASARVLGLEAEVEARLPLGFRVASHAALVDARFTGGAVVDTRRQSDVTLTPEVPLAGHHLPRAPVLAIRNTVGQKLVTELGAIDWIVSVQSKTRHYMTPFNDDGRQGGGLVPLPDLVPAYTRLDVGAGYVSRAGSFEVRGFINNLTNITYMTSFQSGNTRYFAAPRLLGVSLAVHL